MHYDPLKINQNTEQKKWTSISTLDFAPSLLKKFGVDVPSYMNKENIFSHTTR